MATQPANPYRAPAAPLRADRVLTDRPRSDVYAQFDGAAVYAEGRGAQELAS